MHFFLPPNYPSLLPLSPSPPTSSSSHGSYFQQQHTTMKWLTLVVLASLGFTAVLSQQRSECYNTFQGQISTCWDSGRDVKWQCSNSLFKRCLENTPEYCQKDEQMLAIKPGVMAAADTYSKYMCQDQFKATIIDTCTQVLDLAPAVLRKRVDGTQDCTNEHINLEQKLRAGMTVNCRNVAAGMLHTGLHDIVCIGDSPVDPVLKDFITLTEGNYTICKIAFEAEEKCSAKTNVATLCSSKPTTCLQMEFEKAKSCPLESVKKWMTEVQEQYKIREEVACRLSIYEGLNKMIPDCTSNFVKRILFQELLDADEESCKTLEGHLQMMRSGMPKGTLSPQLCMETNAYMEGFIKKLCGMEPPAEVEPTKGDSSGQQLEPFLFLALLSVLFNRLF